MREIYFATTNNGKVASLRSILDAKGIVVVQAPLELPEPRVNSLEAIATEKARYAFDSLNQPCLVSDSGFFIKALNGFPGTFVNYALETIGIEGLLKLTEGKKRRCDFRDCLAYMDGTLQEPVLFNSRVPGALVEEPRGKKHPYHWSALTTIFIPQGYDKTQAEMSEEEYSAWRESSYRRAYLKKFADWLSERV